MLVETVRASRMRSVRSRKRETRNQIESESALIIVHPNETCEARVNAKIADVDVRFTHGLLEGITLIGFTVWERRDRDGHRHVKFPQAEVISRGRRKRFAFMLIEGINAAAALKARILAAVESLPPIPVDDELLDDDERRSDAIEDVLDETDEQETDDESQ